MDGTFDHEEVKLEEDGGLRDVPTVSKMRVKAGVKNTWVWSARWTGASDRAGSCSLAISPLAPGSAEGVVALISAH